MQISEIFLEAALRTQKSDVLRSEWWMTICMHTHVKWNLFWICVDEKRSRHLRSYMFGLQIISNVHHKFYCSSHPRSFLELLPIYFVRTASSPLRHFDGCQLVIPVTFLANTLVFGFSKIQSSLCKCILNGKWSNGVFYLWFVFFATADLNW